MFPSSHPFIPSIHLSMHPSIHWPIRCWSSTWPKSSKRVQATLIKTMLSYKSWLLTRQSCSATRRCPWTTSSSGLRLPWTVGSEMSQQRSCQHHSLWGFQIMLPLASWRQHCWLLAHVVRPQVLQHHKRSQLACFIALTRTSRMCCIKCVDVCILPSLIRGHALWTYSSNLVFQARGGLGLGLDYCTAQSSSSTCFFFININFNMFLLSKD